MSVAVKTYNLFDVLSGNNCSKSFAYQLGKKVFEKTKPPNTYGNISKILVSQNNIEIRPKMETNYFLSDVFLYLWNSDSIFMEIPYEIQIYFFSGMNQKESFEQIPESSILKIDSLIDEIVSNSFKSNQNSIPIYRFGDVFPESIQHNNTQHKSDSLQLFQRAQSLGILHPSLAYADVINEHNDKYKHHRKIFRMYCKKYQNNSLLTLLYLRLQSYNTYFPNQPIDLDRYERIFGNEMSKKQIMSRSIFFGINEFITDGQCGEELKEKWEISSFIGSGSFGNTFEACCGANCKYVMKVFNGKELDVLLEVYTQRFASSLECAPNIIWAGKKIIGQEHKENKDELRGSECGAIVVMERMEKTLYEILKLKWDAGTIGYLYVKIFEKFNTLTANGVIHCDTHSGNIMFVCNDPNVYGKVETLLEALRTGQCSIKFIDFGFSMTDEKLSQLKVLGDSGLRYLQQRYKDIRTRAHNIGCKDIMEYTSFEDWRQFLLFYSNALLIHSARDKARDVYYELKMEILNKMDTSRIKCKGADILGVGSDSDDAQDSFETNDSILDSNVPFSSEMKYMNNYSL
jgi:hypothetical protein